MTTTAATKTNSTASVENDGVIVKTEDVEESQTFSKWREFNINDDGDNDDDDDDDKNGAVNNNSKNDSRSEDEEDTAGLFRMFDTEDDEDVYEDVRYDYPTTTTTSTEADTVTIRHHGAYPHSTGLAVWRGAEILARFLCDQQQQHQQRQRQQRESTTANDTTKEKDDEEFVVNLRNKKVMEVGAGAGLPGIVAHKVLDAASVLVTDGDFDALNNLKYNVDRNRRKVTEVKVDDDDDDDDVDVDGDTSTTIPTTSISCHQLIWGKDTDNFLDRHGKQDVILAADCVYMVPSLKPLWETIDKLLKNKNDDDDGDGDGIFIYAQTAASAVPWKDFKERIEYHNFENIFSIVGDEIKKYDSDNDNTNGTGNGNGDDENKSTPLSSTKKAEEYEQGIYVFRRRRQ